VHLGNWHGERRASVLLCCLALLLKLIVDRAYGDHGRKLSEPFAFELGLAQQIGNGFCYSRSLRECLAFAMHEHSVLRELCVDNHTLYSLWLLLLLIHSWAAHTLPAPCPALNA
jgi:hypothetical protein